MQVIYWSNELILPFSKTPQLSQFLLVSILFVITFLEYVKIAHDGSVILFLND